MTSEEQIKKMRQLLYRLIGPGHKMGEGSLCTCHDCMPDFRNEIRFVLGIPKDQWDPQWNVKPKEGWGLCAVCFRYAPLSYSECPDCRH